MEEAWKIEEAEILPVKIFFRDPNEAERVGKCFRPLESTEGLFRSLASLLKGCISRKSS